MLPGLEHFYPRSPCGERPLTDDVSSGGKIISIHALLAESDRGESDQRHSPGISIHALLAESDAASITPTASRRNFYPRSPCGERQSIMFVNLRVVDISIHALLAESDFGLCEGVFLLRISIHALLAESDTWQRGSRITYVEFLSTLSLRRATAAKNRRTRSNSISIHALLAESDSLGYVRGCFFCVFLSTLSLRRATA